MDQTAQLIAAIAALWSALTGGAVFVVKWLLTEMQRRDTAHDKEVERLNGKLDAASDTIARSAEAQLELIAVQKRMLAEYQAGKVGSGPA